MKTPEFLKLVSELSRNAYKENICIILGAGADIASGGMLFSTLKRKCVREMGSTIHDTTKNDEIDLIFNNFFANLHGQERSNVLNKLMRETNVWEPSEGYQLLLLLAKEHIINSVITTNFDNLLELTEKKMRLNVFQILDAKTVLPQEYILNTMNNMSLYIKMHGDIDSDSVSHLTTQEINTKAYNSHFSKLLQNILEVSTVLIVGYGGYDTKITEIFEKCHNSLKQIYWCNPSYPVDDSPLSIALKGKYTYIKTNFDQLLQEIATQVFLDKKILNFDSVFIWTLLKSKIIKLHTEFIKNANFKKNEYLINRNNYKNVINDFVLNDIKNLCILTGNSGVGKSTFIVQLINSNLFKDFNFIPINISQNNYKNIVEYLAEELGYITHDANAFFLQLVRWFNDNNINAIFVFDNFQILSDTNSLENLISNIIDIAYYARNCENVKFILSLRIEIWNKIMPDLDRAILSKILYQKSNSVNELSSIRIKEFTDNEMITIIDNLLKYSNIKKESYIKTNVKELIRNPFFYGVLIGDESNVNKIFISSIELYERLDAYTIRDIKKGLPQKKARYALVQIAGQMFQNNCNKCDLSLTNISLKTITDIIDRGLLLFNEQYISFRYNIQMIYYLSQYIYLEKLDDIDIYSSVYKLYPKYLEYKVNYDSFILAVSLFKEDLQNTMNDLVCLINNSAEPFIVQLVHDIITEIASHKEDEFINTIILSNNKYQVLFPFYLRASSYMSVSQAFRLLDFIYKNAEYNSQLKKEIRTFIIDRFCLELKETHDISGFFNNYKHYLFFTNTSEYFVMLFSIVSNLGPDNIVPIELYQNVAKDILSLKKSDFNDKEIINLTQSLIHNSYHVLFNAGEDLVEKYYSHSHYSNLIHIIKYLSNGNDLDSNSVKNIFKSISNVDNSIEFIMGNLIFIYYSLKDYNKALNLIYSICETICDNTRVEILDFYLSCVFMITYIQNPRNRSDLVIIMEKIASKCKKIYYEKPSRLSTKIRFKDEFEQEFEDGFNPLAYYFYTAPMCQNEYTCSKELSLYWALKKDLEDNGDFMNISRILHAVGQMISIWPNEGLEALEAFCSYQYPIIRKMLIRILKESYLRFPLNTNTFLERTGSSFQENELKEIKSVSSLEYTDRMMEQLHWARILYFINISYGEKTLAKIIEQIFQENILSELCKKVIFELLPPDKF